MTRPTDRQQPPTFDRDVDRRLLAAARRAHIAEVPVELGTALRAVFTARESLVSRVRRTFVAAMRFDGRAGPALAGIRGGAGAARQLVYACEVADITFHAMNDGEGGWRLDGIVLMIDDDDDDVPFDVRLSPEGEGRDAMSASSDINGEFQFTAVGAGNYRLTVTGPDFDIEVGPFDLEGRYE